MLLDFMKCYTFSELYPVLTCSGMLVWKRAMPNGNPLASALGEDLFIPLNTHITRESQSDRHVIPILDRAIEPTRPLGLDLGT